MKVCYGFGKHGDSAGTRKNERSPWDTIHPGRPWATSEQNKPNKRSAEDTLKDIAATSQSPCRRNRRGAEHRGSWCGSGCNGLAKVRHLGVRDFGFLQKVGVFSSLVRHIRILH